MFVAIRLRISCLKLILFWNFLWSIFFDVFIGINGTLLFNSLIFLVIEEKRMVFSKIISLFLNLNRGFVWRFISVLCCKSSSSSSSYVRKHAVFPLLYLNFQFFFVRKRRLVSTALLQVSKMWQAFFWCEGIFYSSLIGFSFFLTCSNFLLNAICLFPIFLNIIFIF